MAENKTRPTRQSVSAFLEALPDAARRADCQALAALMNEVTGVAGRMWGPAIVGFGDYHYRYASGREGDWFLAGFSPRKNDLTIYVMSGLDDHAPRLARLGKYKAGKSCLYVKRLADIDLGVLRAILEESIKHPMGLPRPAETG